MLHFGTFQHVPGVHQTPQGTAGLRLLRKVGLQLLGLHVVTVVFSAPRLSAHLVSVHTKHIRYSNCFVPS